LCKKSRKDRPHLKRKRKLLCGHGSLRTKGVPQAGAYQGGHLIKSHRREGTRESQELEIGKDKPKKKDLAEEVFGDVRITESGTQALGGEKALGVFPGPPRTSTYNAEGKKEEPIRGLANDREDGLGRRRGIGDRGFALAILADRQRNDPVE